MDRLKLGTRVIFVRKYPGVIDARDPLRADVVHVMFDAGAFPEEPGQQLSGWISRHNLEVVS